MLELKVPPVLLVLLFAVGMWLVSGVTVSLSLSFWFRLVVLMFCALLGMALAIAGLRAFRSEQTTMNPLNPKAASTLVVKGVYRYSRNPMYLGFAVLLTGWGVALTNPYALLMVVGFVLYMNQFQIVPEERALKVCFGDAFDIYVQNVRRWI